MCQETKATTVGVEAVILQEPGLASDSSTSRLGVFVPSQGGPPSLHPSSPPCLRSSTMASCLLSLTVPQHKAGNRWWTERLARFEGQSLGNMEAEPEVRVEGIRKCLPPPTSSSRPTPTLPLSPSLRRLAKVQLGDSKGVLGTCQDPSFPLASL